MRPAIVPILPKAAPRTTNPTVDATLRRLKGGPAVFETSTGARRGADASWMMVGSSCSVNWTGRERLRPITGVTGPSEEELLEELDVDWTPTRT